MSVIKIENATLKNYEINYNKQDLENEYDAYILLKIVKNMFEEGLISNEEKHKITQKIIDHFTPYLS